MTKQNWATSPEARCSTYFSDIVLLSEEKIRQPNLRRLR